MARPKFLRTFRDMADSAERFQDIDLQLERHDTAERDRWEDLQRIEAEHCSSDTIEFDGI